MDDLSSDPERPDFHVVFSDRDREFMQSYFRLADMVADLVGPHSEVVLHSFEDLDRSVVKIVNGDHTGRGVGSPITDVGLKMLRRYLQTGEVNSRKYFTRNGAGELMKSSTCVLAGEGGKPIGMFCVNINVSVPFPELVKTLLPDAGPHALMAENFSASAHDVISQATDKAIADADGDLGVAQKSRSRVIVQSLFDSGIFELKDATSIVAERLGITRHAIYKYLREFKSST